MSDSPTILYIEDHDLNIQLLKKMLRHLPYTIQVAKTGKIGLAMAHQQPPNLILMDINLPDIDGVNLTGLLKTHENLKNVPIIAFTADSSQQTQDRCREIGCAAYLTKPVSKASVLRVLQQFLTTPDDSFTIEHY